MNELIKTHQPIEVGKIIKRNGKLVKILDNTITTDGCITEIETVTDNRSVGSFDTSDSVFWAELINSWQDSISYWSGKLATTTDVAEFDRYRRALDNALAGLDSAVKGLRSSVFTR